MYVRIIVSYTGFMLLEPLAMLRWCLMLLGVTRGELLWTVRSLDMIWGNGFVSRWLAVLGKVLRLGSQLPRVFRWRWRQRMCVKQALVVRSFVAARW